MFGSSETGWDTEEGEIFIAQNVRVEGCNFRRCNTSAINSGLFDGQDGHWYPGVYDLTITNCSFSESYWVGASIERLLCDY